MVCAILSFIIPEEEKVAKYKPANIYCVIQCSRSTVHGIYPTNHHPLPPYTKYKKPYFKSDLNYWLTKLDRPGKTTEMSKVTDKLYHIMLYRA